jgi:hypothetical protein
MSNQRGTFAKRQREMDLKDRARQKAERRAARRDETKTSKGPEIAWDAVVTPIGPGAPAALAAAVAAANDAADDASDEE